jgi:alpha-ketoglutarate-dependent taurine dioxygenase
MLHALEVPSTKGGTMFADMRAAYDTLPSAMKERLAGRPARSQQRPGRREIVRC